MTYGFATGTTAPDAVVQRARSATDGVGMDACPLELATRAPFAAATRHVLRGLSAMAFCRFPDGALAACRAHPAPRRTAGAGT